MPLLKGKSKKSFEHNIKAEMHAGKPQSQALAIAYDMQRRARKKMAKGGEVPSLEEAYKKPIDEPIDEPIEMSEEAKAARGMEGADYEDKMEMDMRKSRMEMHSEDKAATGEHLAGEDDMKYQKKPMMELHKEYKQDDPIPHERALRPGDDMADHSDREDFDFEKRPSKMMRHEDKAAMGMAMADDASEDGEDMIDSIMRKRMARGGMVDRGIDLAAEEAEHSNQYYPINEHEIVGKKWDDRTKSYADDGMDGMDEDYHSPKDMDEDHPDIQEDTFDHISRIIERMHRRKR